MRPLKVLLLALCCVLATVEVAEARETSCTHTVRRGEWLWSIARADPGGRPSDQAVARRAREIQALNRLPDPDRLRPGMVLRLCQGREPGVADFGGYTDAQAVAIDDRDRAVTVGNRSGTIGVLRWLPDGRLDPSFDGDGLVSTKVGTFALGRAVAIDRQGRILAAGSTNPSRGSTHADAVVVRYLPDGRLDRTWTITIGAHATATSLAVEADGRILVAGGADGRLFVRRLDDPTLRVDGPADTYAHDVLSLPDGRIVVVGTTGANESDVLVNWYSPLGVPDGGITVDGGSPFDRANAVTLAPNGYLLVAGSRVLDRTTPDAIFIEVRPEDRQVAVNGAFARGEALDITPDGTVVGTTDDGAGFVRRRGRTTRHTWGAQRGAALGVAIDRQGRAVVAGCRCDGTDISGRGGIERPAAAVVRRFA